MKFYSWPVNLMQMTSANKLNTFFIVTYWMHHKCKDYTDTHSKIVLKAPRSL